MCVVCGISWNAKTSGVARNPLLMCSLETFFSTILFWSIRLARTLCYRNFVIHMWVDATSFLLLTFDGVNAANESSCMSICWTFFGNLFWARCARKHSSHINSHCCTIPAVTRLTEPTIERVNLSRTRFKKRKLKWYILSVIRSLSMA